MEFDYEYFKSEVYRITQIDLNAYKEKQMKRRIDTLILRHHLKGYQDFVNSLKNDKEVLEESAELIGLNYLGQAQNLLTAKEFLKVI